MIEVNSTVFINEADLNYSAGTSSGPGGQHANKVSTRVVLTIPIYAISGLTERQTAKIKSELASYIIKNSLIRIASQKHRSQFANKHEVTTRLIRLLQNALIDRKPRRKTKVPRAVKEKRLKEKKIRSELKLNRRKNGLS